MDESAYRLIVSELADADLAEIVRFIAEDDPIAARRFGNELVDEAVAITQFPYSGRAFPRMGDPSIRERIYGLYRIIYLVDSKARIVTVARFWHASRGEPDL